MESHQISRGNQVLCEQGGKAALSAALQRSLASGLSLVSVIATCGFNVSHAAVTQSYLSNCPPSYWSEFPMNGGSRTTRKMGFGVLLSDCFRGPLRRVMGDTLLDAQLMAPLAIGLIRQTLGEFERGGNEDESWPWALLIFGIWRRQRAVA